MAAEQAPVLCKGKADLGETRQESILPKISTGSKWPPQKHQLPKKAEISGMSGGTYWLREGSLSFVLKKP